MDWVLVASVAVPVGLGAAVGMLTKNETKGAWYESLNKPSWKPPNWVFAPVWTLLYILMGVAFWRMWKATRGTDTTANLLFALQLALNLAWSLLFFNAHNLQGALFDIVALLGVLTATFISFYRVDHTAGLLLVPYVLWVAFATILTAFIYFNNRPGATGVLVTGAPTTGDPTTGAPTASP